MNLQYDRKLDAAIVHARTAHAGQRDKLEVEVEVEVDVDVDAILERQSS